MRSMGRPGDRVLTGLVVLVLAGCTGVAPPSDADKGSSAATAHAWSPSARSQAVPAGREAVTGSSGFAVSDGSTTLVGPAGVAPTGTTVTVRPAPNPALPAGIKWTDAAPAFDVTLAAGGQPAKPVTASIAIDPGRLGREKLVFLTLSSAGAWEGLPVTITGATASVQMTHFSQGFWGWVADAEASFKKGVNGFLKLRFSAPACADKSLTVAGVNYSASVDGVGVWVCTELDSGSPALTLYSNSPFVWRVKGTETKLTPTMPVPPVELTGVLTLAVARAALGKAHETYVVPGGHAGLLLPEGGDAAVRADVDPALGALAIAVAGVEAYLSVSGVTVPALEQASVGECAAGLIQTGGDPAATGEVTRAVIDCFKASVTGPAAVATAIVSSMAGLLVTQVAGAMNEAIGLVVGQTPNHLKVSVTARAKGPTGTDDPSGWVVGPGTFGPLRMGMTGTEAAKWGLPAYVPGGCAVSEHRRASWVVGSWDLSTETPTLDAIRLQEGATAKTARGIHLGSPMQAVVEAYGPARPFGNTGEVLGWFISGSRGGLVITLGGQNESGVVDNIVIVSERDPSKFRIEGWC